MEFTVNDLLDQFGSGTFARGEDYFRRDRVTAVARDGASIDGEVSGSGGSEYEVSVYLEFDRRGVRFDGGCSCPVGHNCKHVVAALLAFLDRGEQAPGAGFSLPMQAERWLQQLARVQAEEEKAAAPAIRSSCLVYVLIPERQGRILRLYLCKARLRMDGSIGSATIIRNGMHDLLSAQPAHFGRDDDEPVRLMAALRAGDSYAEDIIPSGRIGARLLDLLCADGRLLWARTAAELSHGNVQVVLPGPPRQAVPAWQTEDVATGSVGLRWCCDDGAAVGHVLATEPMHYLDDGVLGELRVPARLEKLPPATLLDLVQQAPVLAPDERAGMAARLVALGLDSILPPPQALDTLERKDVIPTPCLLLNSHAHVVRNRWDWYDYAQLAFDYDGMSTDHAEGAVLRRVVGDNVERIVRDMDRERAALDLLAELGFDEPHVGTPLDKVPDALVLPAEADWLAFVRHGLPRLRAAGWQIEFDGNYRYDLAEAEEWYAELEEDGEGNAWFELELGIIVEGQRHALLPLLLQMIRQAPHDFSAAALAQRADDSEFVMTLADANRVALPWGRVKPILATLAELYFTERLGSKLRLPFTDAARLAELERAAQLRWIGGDRLRELGRKLDGFDGLRHVEVPAGLQATLRPYQHTGLTWMQFLREYGFAGILADDMGLGKTVQTLAHILAEKEAGRLDAPALVVAPTSLMGNWQAEAARFAPSLRVLLLHGKDRAALFDQVAGADLVLTTYPLLGRDEDALRQHRYHLLILDEAQYVKNSRAKAAQTVRLLDARHRLCLTGTPVQNHLGELWSQFHFLMPGLLGEEKAFNTGFRKPIEQHGDSLRRELLLRRVRPFMLRRTKDKVATELPPKTEIVLPVDFGPAQRDLYETVRLAMDSKVRAEIDRKGLARSQIVILDALLKLRQVCCDPRLLKSAAREAGSAKLEALLELLETLLSEGRKVLVFSQFTSMLALIEVALRARAVEFSLLTGDTVDRAAPIAAFQHGSASVFLISLKAGGVGLNLTAADTVIHYDPWWNPASENQATDRAWRIGQEQPVFVYKLIARGTLEEKIQEMQRRKGELANAVLSPEGGLSATFSADDLQAIFALPQS